LLSLSLASSDSATDVEALATAGGLTTLVDAQADEITGGDE